MSTSNDTVTFTVSKAWLYAVAGFAVGAASGFVAANLLRGAAAEPDTRAAVARAGVLPTSGGADGAPATEGRPFIGPEDAPVTIVEFTDYQCPFCARHHRETKEELLKRYPGAVRYVVRNFPLPNIHPLAQKAAEAVECALDQGKFWEYGNLLFQRLPNLATDKLKGYAAELGLDTDRFEQCLDSGAKAQVVAADVAEGRRVGVRSTPSFFINGQPLVGAKPLVEFQSAIDDALEEARGGS